jgi:hypothetical protein
MNVLHSQLLAETSRKRKRESDGSDESRCSAETSCQVVNVSGNYIYYRQVVSTKFIGTDFGVVFN